MSFETDLFKTLGQAVLEGQQQPRPYNGTSVYKPDRARFKMKIWYRDGNSRVYYSFDSVHDGAKGAHVDEWNGLKKLIRLAHVHHVDHIKTCVIWATVATDPQTVLDHYNYEVFKVTRSGWKESKLINFVTNEKHTILDTNKLFYYASKKL